MGWLRRVLDSRVTVIGLWVLAAAIAVILLYARYRSVLGDGVWFDFTHYFLPSGEAIRAGKSPYVVDGYVYSPILALLVAVTLGSAQPIAVWTIFNLAAAVGVVALVTAALWPKLRAWQRPLVAVFAVTTLLWNWLTTLMLSSGQTDLYVMLSLSFASLCASRRRAVGTGVGVALAALMKTWPIIVGIWFFRRGAHRRWTSLFAAIGTGSLALVLVAVIWGPQAIIDWIGAVLDARDQPGLIHFNVLSVGNQLFGDGPGMDVRAPVPWLAIAVTVFGVIAVVALLGLSLWRPGDDVLSLWNVMFALVLLLPVSHSVYLILGLPILWIWFARLLRHPRRPGILVAFIVWAVWWIVSARVQWAGDTFTTMSTSGYATVMFCTLAAVAASIVIEAAADRRQSSAVGAGVDR